MNTDEARAQLFEIFRDLEAHKLDGYDGMQCAISRALDRYNRILEAWEPERATLLDDPQSRAVARVVLSGLAMAGLLARPMVYGPNGDVVDGTAFWLEKDIADAAVRNADALMEVLSNTAKPQFNPFDE